MSLHQQDYNVLRIGLDAGLSKQQISNLFNSQGAFGTSNLSPLTPIEKFSGVCDEFYHHDCQGIPDPSTLDSTQNNLLLLNDCFIGKQIKAEAYYTRGRQQLRHEIHCTKLLPRHVVRENSNFIILFPQDVKDLTHIHVDHCASDISHSEFKQFCHGVWISEKHNFVTIDLTSAPMGAKYRQNFNQFYSPAGTM